VKDAKIFKCTGNEQDRVPDSLLCELGFNYDEANSNAQKMALLSNAIKEHQNKSYCTLPFCHTVEAEAFGSSIILNNELGNRIAKYAINVNDDFDKINKIDFNSGRISKLLESIKILKRQGEKVCLDVTGPISLATSIMDSQIFYKSVRKDKGKIDKLMEVIEDSIVEFMLKAVELGVDVISYADPTGTIDIVGPKIYRDLSGQSTYRILKRVENKLGNTVIHICGKTSTSLEAIELLEIEKIEAEGNNYFEMLARIKEDRNDIRFIGHWCMKLDKANLKGAVSKCVLLEKE
jgi:uroporphyrinogen-III decarboxylase